MKRLFSVILSLVMLFTLIQAVAFAADDTPLDVIVAADIQVSYLESESGPQERNSSELYNSAYGISPVMYASRATLEAFLDKAAESDAKALLIAGSLVNGGFDGTETEPDSVITEAEERAVADRLAQFAQDTGKKVFVIDGDRDVKAEYGKDGGISISAFKEIWRNVTYVNAYAVDPDSCSYTADIDANYRLIAIDAMANRDSVLAWAENQADIADSQGKRLVGLMGASLINHVPEIAKDKVAFGVYEQLAREFARWGVKYTFTGSVGINDVSTYSFSGYQAIYDVCTGPLTSYPATYRTVTLSRAASFNTYYLDSIDTTGLHCNEQMSAALADSFTSYIKSYQAAGLDAYIDDILTVDGVKDLLMKKFSMRPAYYRNIYANLETIVPAVKEIINKPLYGESDSFASIAASYEADIPEGIEYDTYESALIAVIQQVIHGDEAVYSTSDLGKLILNGAAVVLNYALSQLDGETFLLVMDDICRRASVTLTPNAQDYVSDPVNRQKILQTVSDGCAAMFDLICVDDNPADTYSYTLAGYDNYRDAPVQTTVSILERIANFFNAIVNFFKNLFSRFGK